MEKQEWIIGIGGTDLDAVFFYTAKATKNELREILSLLANEEATIPEVRDSFEYTSDIVERQNSDAIELYVYNQFDRWHTDYCARPLSTVTCLTDRRERLTKREGKEK